MGRRYYKPDRIIIGRPWQATVKMKYHNQTNTHSMSYQISGMVKVVLPEKQISQDFRFREIVITRDGSFSQQIILQFRNSKADLLSGITPGAEVTINFDIAGKAHESNGDTRWFNTLVGLDINKN